MLTDYILLQLMAFANTHLDLVQFMFLELVLSSASDPVAVEYENTATLLTGIADYAIVSSVHRAAIAQFLRVELDAVEDSEWWRVFNHPPDLILFRNQGTDWWKW